MDRLKAFSLTCVGSREIAVDSPRGKLSYKMMNGMMFLILSGVYVPLALVVGRLSDKLVSTP